MKAILFIGGAGFIGSNLIKTILKNTSNYRIHVLEPDFAGFERLAGLDVEIHKGTLNNFDYLQSIIISNKIQIVVHLVSTMIPNSTYEDYKREFENVIFPTIRLVKFCGEKQIKFIYFSSGGTIYGNKRDHTSFKEEDALNPISYYGLSKQILENSILFESRTTNCDYLILRPSNPFGKGQNLYGNQGLIAVSLGKILTNQAITVFGDGNIVRDFIYIDDLSNIFLRLLEKNVSKMILNIGMGIGYTINEIIDILKRTVNENIQVNYVSTRKVDVSNVILNNEKLRSLINYKFTNIEDGISLFYNNVKDTVLNKQ